MAFWQELVLSCITVKRYITEHIWAETYQLETLWPALRIVLHSTPLTNFQNTWEREWTLNHARAGGCKSLITERQVDLDQAISWVRLNTKLLSTAENLYGSLSALSNGHLQNVDNTAWLCIGYQGFCQCVEINEPFVKTCQTWFDQWHQLMWTNGFLFPRYNEKQTCFCLFWQADVQRSREISAALSHTNTIA